MTIQFEQILGLAAGLITSLSSLPQLIKMYQEKEAEDVSLKMIIILIVGVILWIVYGIMKEDVPIVVTNGISVALNSFVLFFKIKYDKK